MDRLVKKYSGELKDINEVNLNKFSELYQSRQVCNGKIIMIEIKKYSNRRLYNTETSSYITQEDVVSLIRQGKQFKIRDVETKKDITSSILTQIVLERETMGTNLIPEEFLKQIILFYENDRSSEMFGFLNNVMNFADANKFFTSGFENIMKFNPFDFQNYFNNNANNNKKKIMIKIIIKNRLWIKKTNKLMILLIK